MFLFWLFFWSFALGSMYGETGLLLCKTGWCGVRGVRSMGILSARYCAKFDRVHEVHRVRLVHLVITPLNCANCAWSRPPSNMKAWFTRKSLIIKRSSWSSRFVLRRSRCKSLINNGSSWSSWSSCRIIGHREMSFKLFARRSLRLCGAIFYPAHSYGRAWTHEPIY